MEETVQSRALKRAAEILGGKANLREHLKCSARELDTWLAAIEKPPMDVFLKAVDIISAAPVLSKPAERARQLRQKADAVLARANAAQQRSLAVRDAILERQAEWAHPGGRLASAPAFLEAKYEPRDGREMVEAALGAAITATGTSMGNVQITCPDGLRIVAQRGFQQPFLDFFAVVEQGSCCAVARQAGRRVVIPDVSSDPLFSGTAAGAVLCEAGVRAVQSTPLVASGEVLGMISTHYAMPHQLTDKEGDVLDHIARRAAFWLDGGAI